MSHYWGTEHKSVPDSVLFVGSICGQQSSLRMLKDIEGRLNTSQYIAFLENLFSESRESFSLLHDHYPVHHAIAVRNWLAKHPKIHVLPVPPKSGDLNFLSDVWELIVDYVNNHYANEVMSVERLSEIVPLAWESIVTDAFVEEKIEKMPIIIDTLIKTKGGSLFLESINSISDRCRAVIAAKSEHTRY